MKNFVESLENRRHLSATNGIRPAPSAPVAALIGPVRPAANPRVTPVTPAASTSSYSGIVFQDYDGDGQYTSGDEILSGRVVFNDANDNGAIDNGEPSTTSSTFDGRYTFVNLPAGQPLNLRLTDAARRSNVATTPAAVTGTTAEGGTYTNNFGLFPTFINVPVVGGSLTTTRVVLSADGSRLLVSSGGSGASRSYSVPKTLLTTFGIFGGSGDDTLILDLTNGNAFGPTLNFYGQGDVTGDRVAILSAAGGSSVTIGTSSISAGPTTLNYQTTESLTFTGSSVSDSVTLVGATLRDYAGGGGTDYVNMLGGVFAPLTNLGASNSSNVYINANFSAAVNFSSPQRLASLTLNGNSTATVLGSGATLRVAALSINAAGGAGLNLNANSMILDYTDASPLETIRSYLVSGLTSNAGIRSGSAAVNGRRLGYGEARLALGLTGSATGQFISQPVDATTILIRYTIAGDADLDGGVSINDFNRLSANFGVPAGRYWTDGDFDFDGGVSIDDFNALSVKFGQSV